MNGGSNALAIEIEAVEEDAVVRGAPSASFRSRRGKLSEWSEREVDPVAPTVAEPGTSKKVITLAARYAAGVPLWNHADRDGHNPLSDDDEN